MATGREILFKSRSKKNAFGPRQAAKFAASTKGGRSSST